MVDLQVSILTHSQSTRDVQGLAESCRLAFRDENLRLDIRIYYNDKFDGKPLTAGEYLTAALSAQTKVARSRLSVQTSQLVALWHLRQLAGLSASLLRLVSVRHRRKVGAESVRAARIAYGHSLMWKQALNHTSKLYLFLEDDVILRDPQCLVETTIALLTKSKKGSLPFICDCSHSFFLSELGVDAKFAVLDDEGVGVQSFDFPFTNTLAANFVSSSLVQATVEALNSDGAKRGLGIDLDLMRLWADARIAAKGLVSSKPIFEQQSRFRVNKI